MKITVLLLMICSMPLMAADKAFKIKEEAVYERKSFDAFVGSSDLQEVKVEADEWSSWKVEEAVPHGAVVKKGDPLVSFQKTRLADALEKKQRDLRLQQLNLEKQKIAVQQVEFTARKELELVRLKAEIASKAELLYKTTGRKRYIENLENDVSDMEKNLKYQMSELDQLQKMYTQDSLKEESEEIVLQRQKDAVERAKRYVELRKKVRDDSITLKLPLNDFNNLYNNEKAKNAVNKAEIDWQAKIMTEKNKLADAEKALQSALEKLEKLDQEKKWLSVAADHDGTAYVAMFNEGKWSSKHKNELNKDTAVTVGTVIMTLVGQNLNQVEVRVPEADKELLGEGSTAYISVSGRRYILKELSKDSIAKNGSYKVVFELPDFPKYFGMPVEVKLFRKVADKALTLPLNFLRYKDEAPDKPYVMVKGKDKQQEVFVILGESVGDKVLVTEGLKAGDTVILP